MSRIRSHDDLEVYQIAFEAAGKVFEISKGFPEDEFAGLVEPMRKSSRAVCTHIAEGWRKRRSLAAFVGCMSEAEAEAGGMQSLLSLASNCDYIFAEENQKLQRSYDHVLGKLVGFIANPDPWLIRNNPRKHETAHY